MQWLFTQNVRNEAVMGGSRWFHNPDEPDVRKVPLNQLLTPSDIHYNVFFLKFQQDLFVADRSGILEKRGSIRFQVKAAAYPKAEVSTEFQIILVNRPGFHKFTTVFGQVK